MMQRACVVACLKIPSFVHDLNLEMRLIVGVS